MHDATCPYCHSTKIKIVHSYANRDVMVIQCLNCGKESTFDTENEQTSIGDVTPPDGNDHA